MRKFNFKNFFNQTKSLIDFESSVTINKLKKTAKLFKNANNKGGKIIFIGNGGSASAASHVSVDLTKNAKIKSINFNEANLITCLANDYGYENYFEKALKLYANKNDIVVLISCSGSSPNLVKAIKFCLKYKIKCITFTGRKKNNLLKKLNKKGINFWVNSNSYNIIEVVHLTWLLSIVDCVIGTSEYEPS